MQSLTPIVTVLNKKINHILNPSSQNDKHPKDRFQKRPLSIIVDLFTNDKSYEYNQSNYSFLPTPKTPIEANTQSDSLVFTTFFDQLREEEEKINKMAIKRYHRQITIIEDQINIPPSPPLPLPLPLPPIEHEELGEMEYNIQSEKKIPFHKMLSFDTLILGEQISDERQTFFTNNKYFAS